MRTVILLCLGVFLLGANEAQAMIFINEILADPPALIGDANGDGIASITQDEFLEMFNDTDSPVFLSGWTLADSLKTRHRFPVGSIINGRQTMVIFGGGNPALPGVSWQTASTGTLGLNNDGDSVILKDDLGALIDQVVYGAEGGKDESLTRDPNDPSRFILHTQADLTLQRRYSPGDPFNIPEPVPEEDPAQEEPVVEEPAQEEPGREEPVFPDPVGNPRNEEPVFEEPVFVPADNDPQQDFPSTSAVPEPATVVCLGAGMGMAVLLKRKSGVFN